MRNLTKPILKMERTEVEETEEPVQSLLSFFDQTYKCIFKF